MPAFAGIAVVDRPVSSPPHSTPAARVAPSSATPGRSIRNPQTSRARHRSGHRIRPCAMKTVMTRPSPGRMLKQIFLARIIVNQKTRNYVANFSETQKSSCRSGRRGVRGYRSMSPPAAVTTGPRVFCWLDPSAQSSSPRTRRERGDPVIASARERAEVLRSTGCPLSRA